MSRLVYQRSVIFAASCLIFGSWLAVASCGQTATASTPATRTVATAPAAPKVAVPASVPALITVAQKFFDAANANDWTAATTQSTALKAALKKVQSDIPKADAEQAKRLREISTHITAVDTAIKGKQRQAALMGINRIIRVSGILADTFINPVPQAVWQMEYLAREMQVWSSDPADISKLKAVPARVDVEWAIIGKDVTAKGGDALVKEFTDETAKLKTAATADDFAKLTKPLLDTLDKFEKAYVK